MTFWQRLFGPRAAEPVEVEPLPPAIPAPPIDLDPAQALLAQLQTPGPLPDGDPDPFVTAWATSHDLDAMIGLLLLGGQRGVYGIGSSQTSSDRHGGPPTRWLFRMQLPDRRYVRVDITREGGVEALRAIVPALEPRAMWAAGLIAAHEALTDPLTQLMFALGTAGEAQPQWLARWSEGGEPLAAAWQCSTDSVAMRRLLERAGRADLAERAQAEIAAVPMPRHDGRGHLITPQMQRASDDYSAGLADAVRRAVPRPPALSQITQTR